jgi:hypothetical protein
MINPTAAIGCKKFRVGVTSPSGSARRFRPEEICAAGVRPRKVAVSKTNSCTHRKTLELCSWPSSADGFAQAL